MLKRGSPAPFVGDSGLGPQHLVWTPSAPRLLARDSQLLPRISLLGTAAPAPRACNAELRNVKVLSFRDFAQFKFANLPRKCTEHARLVGSNI